MEKPQKLSIAALIFSILPVATFVPSLIHSHLFHLRVCSIDTISCHFPVPPNF